MKNRFIKSTIILTITAIITKVLGMITKIYLTRQVNEEIIGTYMLLLPTLLLVLTLADQGIPFALTKLISTKKYNNKKLLFQIIPIIIISNILLMIILISNAKFISNNLLKNNNLYLGIISISLLIPFSTITSIIRSYFLGKTNTFPILISNTIELLSKLIIYILYLPNIKYKSISYIISFLILSNIITSILSIITYLLFLPKNISITKDYFIPKYNYLKSIYKISIPNTSTKLIHSISLFLEPIIITNVLRLSGYSIKYITYNYGIITGYVIPLITLPIFIISAISEALLPSISYDYSNNDIKKVKNKLKLTIFLSLIIGLSSTLLLILTPKLLLRLIYKTNKGIKYIRILSPIIILRYITIPIEITMDAINKSFINMKASIIECLIKTITLLLLSFMHLGLYPLIISIIISTIIDFTYHLIKLNKYLY